MDDSLADFSERQLICRDCNEVFQFTISEQKYFAAKKLGNDPKRCHQCRLADKIKRSGADPAKVTAAVPCYRCGKSSIVPFIPNGHKPVYCSDCFHQTRLQVSSEYLESQKVVRFDENR